MKDLKNHNLNTEDYKEISRMVESGEIFNDAREWYLRTYLLTIVERSWVIVITVALLFLTFTAYDYKNSLLPVVSSYPVLVTIKDSGNQISKLTKLADREDNFDINDIYLKLISEEFVKSFEEYDWQNDFQVLKNNAKLISGLAYENIFDSYSDRVSVRKLNSFTLKYRKNIVRTIDVNKSTLSVIDAQEARDGNKKYLISGTFTAQEKGGGEIKSESYEFRITAYFKDITYNHEKKQFEDLYYKVANYDVYRK